MKRLLAIGAALIIALVIAAGCKKTEKDLNDVYTNDLFAEACNCIPWTVLGNDVNGDLPWMQFWSGYLSESKNNRYGQLGTPSQYPLIASLYQHALGKLDRIIQLNEDPAKKDLPNVQAFGSNANQIAAAKTLSAFFYMFLTDMTGPIVFSKTFLGDAVENYAPSYMNQNEVYRLLDAILNESYNLFETSGGLYYADLVYGGDISKWRKFNASLRMLLAIKLCDVDAGTGKSRFARAYSDGGMTMVSDGFHFTYGNPGRNLLYYWCSNGYAKADKNLVPNRILVEKMKELKDSRMFVYFDIEGYKGARDESLFPRNQYSSFHGAPFGLASNADVTAFADCICSINSRMLAINATIPVIPTARILLVEAEAAIRGWISADAKKLYENGIRASFEWWGADYATPYINSSAVAYDSHEAMEQIATQRWIASYLSDGVETWSDWRRLDIPLLPVGPAALDKGIDQYPYRLKFPSDPASPYTNISFKDAVEDLRGKENTTANRLWWDVTDNTKSALTPEQCTPPVVSE